MMRRVGQWPHTKRDELLPNKGVCVGRRGGVWEGGREWKGRVLCLPVEIRLDGPQELVELRGPNKQTNKQTNKHIIRKWMGGLALALVFS